MQMAAAAQEMGWSLDFASIASMWRGGCIIRSTFLGNIKAAYEANPQLENLTLDPFFTEALKSAEAGWREAVIIATRTGISVPAFSAALSYFDGYRSERLPANLLQAQRDYFGAHSYERVDRARGEFFHTDWTGHGGKVASTTYQV